MPRHQLIVRFGLHFCVAMVVFAVLIVSSRARLLQRTTLASRLHFGPGMHRLGADVGRLQVHLVTAVWTERVAGRTPKRFGMAAAECGARTRLGCAWTGTALAGATGEAGSARPDLPDSGAVAQHPPAGTCMGQVGMPARSNASKGQRVSSGSSAAAARTSAISRRLRGVAPMQNTIQRTSTCIPCPLEATVQLPRLKRRCIMRQNDHESTDELPFFSSR